MVASETDGRAMIDVIVPCYGYGHLLANCVGSVLRQSFRALRVLIIDDASPDDTTYVAAELARKDDRVSVISHTASCGPVATYNEGLEWATAKYALLLPADDQIAPGAIKRAIELLEACPDMGFAYGAFIEIGSGEDVPSLPERSAEPGWTVMSGENFFRANRFGNPVATCTAVMRTQVQRTIGGFRADLPHAGDMEMWLRIAALGSVGYVHAVQGIYRRHTHSMSVSAIRNRMQDLHQRKSALDDVFYFHGAHLSKAVELRDLLYGGLAIDAVASASEPFSRGDVDQFDDILAFAEELDPAVRASLRWRFQKMKRLLGPRVWSALLPARGLARMFVGKRIR